MPCQYRRQAHAHVLAYKENYKLLADVVQVVSLNDCDIKVLETI